MALGFFTAQGHFDGVELLGELMAAAVAGKLKNAAMSRRNFFKCSKEEYLHMGVSKNGGTQQPWFFLLKMTILGCFGGTTISGNTHIFTEKAKIVFLNIFGMPGTSWELQNVPKSLDHECLHCLRRRQNSRPVLPLSSICLDTRF